MKSAVYKAVIDDITTHRGLDIVIPARLPLANATPAALAQALAVDELVYSHLDCSEAFCNISLRRYSGREMIELADLRIPLDSYGVMHRQLSTAVPRLYADIVENP